MQNRSLLDEFNALPASLRRYLYTNALDEKTVGRLNQTCKQFNLFGNDIEMWRMRIRKEVPEIYMPQTSSSIEYIAFYLLIRGIKELHAFSLQWMINSFFRHDYDDQDAALSALQMSLIDGSWQPLSNNELHELAMSLQADEKTYAIINKVADIISSGIKQLTVDPSTTNQNAEPAETTSDEETQTIIDNLIKIFSSGEHRVQWLYSTVEPQEALADEAVFAAITSQFALGSIMHHAVPFLLARNHIITLFAFLQNFHTNYPALLDVKIPTGEGPVNLGEQLFMMALGAEELTYDRLIFWLPCTPTPELIKWMIEKNVDCVRANNHDILHSICDDHIFYNPLYLTIEAIASINHREKKPDSPIRDLQKLQMIALSLLDHGEVMDRVAIVRDKISKTPAWLIATTLESLNKDNLSEVEIAIRNTLTAIRDHQPTPMPVNKLA